MWPLTFISEEDFTEHVQKTIEKYGKKLEPFDLKKFNSNIIDPIKLIFDKIVYQASWEQIVRNEIFRQRDKSNNNDIGYFHQNFFEYIPDCTVPEDGWDVIYKNPKGIPLPDGQVVHTIYVEIKNKHNTMNAASSRDTYMAMQSQLLQDDDCACFLVEVVAKKSQNIKWSKTIKGKTHEHNLIRKVSMDQFYALVTGVEDAFCQMCMILPKVVENTIESAPESLLPNDTVIDELKSVAETQDIESEDLALAMAVYMLGFGSYIGFIEK